MYYYSEKDAHIN